MAFEGGAENRTGAGTGLLARLWKEPAPSCGCEISPSGVLLASWGPGSAVLDTAAWRPLSAGAIDASPLRDNMPRQQEVSQALAGCMESLGQTRPGSGPGKPRNAVLVIPDQVARLFVVDMDHLPQRTREAVQLIRWKLKKSVPFDIETSTLSYFSTRQNGQRKVVTVVTPRTIIERYEAVLLAAGLRPRRVTLSSLAAMSLLPEAGSRAGELAQSAQQSILLVKYSPPWLTTAILHQGSLSLFRTVALGRTGSEMGSSSEFLEAVHPSVAYFQDNFGANLDHAFLCGLGTSTRQFIEEMETQMEFPATPLMERPVGAAIHGVADEETDRVAAGLLGVLAEVQSR